MAEGRTALALAVAQTLALKTHPAVQEATAQAMAAGYGVLRAQARHLPNVGVQTGSPLGGGGGSGASQGVNVTLNLWAGGAMQAQTRQNQAAFEAQRQRLYASCVTTAEGVADAYVATLRADALGQQADTHVARLDELLHMVREIAQVDRGRRSDIDAVQARREVARAAQLEVASQAQQSRHGLRRLVGTEVEPTPEGLAAWAVQGLAETLAQAQQEAMAASAALRAAALERQSAEHAVVAARAARWPMLNLVAAHARERQDGTSRTDNRVSLQTQWAAFNGGQDHLAEQASAQGIVVADSRLEDLHRALRQEVAKIWEARHLARARAQLAPLQLRAVQAVLETHTELFRLGRRSVLDLLTATQEVHQAQVTAVDAAHEGLLQDIRLASVTGLGLARLNLEPQHPCGSGAAALPPSGLPFPLPRW
jgi:outer membrane protein, adhesin transport system